MYLPQYFKIEDRQEIHQAMRSSRLATLVTATADGPFATPLPLIFDADEGEHGTLYGHIAKPNRHWKLEAIGESLAIFTGPDAYITPSWLASKAEHGKVVPTWNYVAIHAYGPAEFFDDAARLHDVVTRLTRLYEEPREDPWAVSDAPADYIANHLKAIIGLRLPITRLFAKSKMSQNRTLPDRVGIADGLAQSENTVDRVVATLVPTTEKAR